MDRYILSRINSAWRSRYGVFQNLMKAEFDNPLTSNTIRYTVETANMQCLQSPVPRMAGGAIDTDPLRAFYRASFEAVERYAFNFSHDRLMLEGLTYEEVKSCYKTPPIESYALFSDDQYLSPEFPFIPFTKDTRLDWIKVTRARDGDPSWIIPASMVLNIPHRRRLRLPSSNGVAFGLSVQSALERATLELIERDAVCIYWRNWLAGVRIDLTTCSGILSDTVASFGRYRDKVEVYWLKTDLNLPCVIATFRGDNSAHEPGLILTGGSDFDPIRAIQKSLIELGQMPISQRDGLPNLNDCRYDLDPKDCVRFFHDHTFYYINSSRAQKCNFLFEGSNVSIDHFVQSYIDAPKSINSILDHFQSLDLDVFYYNHTTRDLSDLGGSVIRAIAPGLIEIDGDHRMMTTAGRRLREVPVGLGLRSSPLQEHELNLNPHPFP